MNVIPAIDLKGGRCVRLLKGDFGAVTEYDAAPTALAERYLALGAHWIHCVDLDGARSGTAGNLDSITTMACRTAGRLQVGGGVREAGDLARLLDAGAGRVVAGSTAIEQPAVMTRWLEEHGPEQIVLALDVACRDRTSEPTVMSRGWTVDTGFGLWRALDRYTSLGIRHVLCTDIGRDGAMTGPAIQLYDQCVQRYPQVAFQASGGVRDVVDLESLRDTGVAAAIVGRALLEGRILLSELGPYLPSA